MITNQTELKKTYELKDLDGNIVKVEAMFMFNDEFEENEKTLRDLKNYINKNKVVNILNEQYLEDLVNKEEDEEVKGFGFNFNLPSCGKKIKIMFLCKVLD